MRHRKVPDALLPVLDTWDPSFTAADLAAGRDPVREKLISLWAR